MLFMFHKIFKLQIILRKMCNLLLYGRYSVNDYHSDITNNDGLLIHELH